MILWLFLLRRYRFRRCYRQTVEALSALDVPARADIGVSWLEIGDVARRAANRAVYGSVKAA